MSALLGATLAACSTGEPSSSAEVSVDAPAPQRGDRAECDSLLAALPASVADQPGRRVDGDGAVAAWGDPAIVLTCGVDRPDAFRRVSACTTVNGVDWFLPEDQLDSEEPVDLTMTTVNRQPFVQVLLPAEYWPPATTLADLSQAVLSSTNKTGSCR